VEGNGTTWIEKEQFPLLYGNIGQRKRLQINISFEDDLVERSQCTGRRRRHTSLCTKSLGEPYLKLRLKRGYHIICSLMALRTPGMMVRDMLRQLARMSECVITNSYCDLLIGVKPSVIFLHLECLFTRTTSEEGCCRVGRLRRTNSRTRARKVQY
jgi:hypothetical protein